ncbi:thioredoxin O2, mitochondrial-like, partial [Phalaenopsis equestris]|uniref:thioredoxin O2, mitochondrial-like n=1 Tax=Phalaenopsis equestris TaxID=78828 RepID=UPI0009E3A1F6
MRRDLFLRLRSLAALHSKTLSCSPNPSSLHQLHRSLQHEIRPHSSVSLRFINPFPLLSRAISSTSSSPANIVHIGSEEGFNEALKKAQDEKLPSIFYFTAAWCGPCKLLEFYLCR